MERRLAAALVVLVIGVVLVFEGVKFITAYPASHLPMVVVGMVLLVGYCALAGDLLNVRFRSESMFAPLVPPLVVMGLVLLVEAGRQSIGYEITVWASLYVVFGAALLVIPLAWVWWARHRR